MDFSKRSYELELMDLPFEKKEEFFSNLSEIEIINKLTGGPKHTFSTLKKLLKEYAPKGVIEIADIGFGAGDMLQYLLNHENELPCKVKLVGIDLLPEAKEYALLHHPKLASKVEFHTCDYRDYMKTKKKVDIIIAALFCHHLTDEQLIEFFSYIKEYTSIGGIINDLARSPIAYYGIKIPTQLFSKSRFTKNDAPLSVLRGFHRHELEKILSDAQVSNYSLKWKWAYRYLLTIRSNGK